MSNTIILKSQYIEINGKLITDLANDDAGKITFPNEAINMKIGGSIAIGFKADAGMADFELKVMRGSGSDQFLQTLQHTQNVNQDTILTGKVMNNFRGDNSEICTLGTGMFTTTQPELTVSTSASDESLIAIYKMKFATSERLFYSIQNWNAR